MSSWPQEHFRNLCSELAGDDPERALAAGLRVLEAAGFVPHSPERGPAWLVVERDQCSIELDAHVPASDQDHLLLEAILGIALTRVIEQRRHRQTRERLEMMSAGSFEGILIHVDGVVIDANQRLAEILRCERAQLLGPTMLEWGVVPEDRPNVLCRIASGFEGAYVITGVRFDGSRFRAELQSKQGRLGDRPVRVVAVRDVTERERTLALLRESEQQLRDLADTVFDLTVLSRGGVVVDARGAVSEILGCEREQLVGRSLMDFVAPSAAPLVNRMVAAAHSGTYESTIISATGELIPVEVVGVNSTLGGQPTRVAGLRDLRKARQLESERRRLELQLERAQRLNGLGVLAGGIAHDFNNLLVGVMGNADLLLATTTDPEASELLQAIIGAGQQAANLTAQMLAYAGRRDVRSKDLIDLAELFAELQILLTATLSKKAEFLLDLEPDSVIVGDRTTLTQVLMNLLTNASDALQGKEGRVAVRTRRVTHPDARWDDALGSTVGPGDWILVEVEDSGAGMDQSVLTRIFEPFFSTKATGHGLGLAACVGIVASHGGALRVESQPGRGTCFSLLLPAGKVMERQQETPPVPESTPCRVLVIDDEAVVRNQMRRSLELRGFAVTEAQDGRSGLASFAQRNPDLIVLDLTMSDLDGPEVIREIRRAGSSVPIVLTSGYASTAAELRLEPGSFQAFLRKPYGVAELLEAIERARAQDSP